MVCEKRERGTGSCFFVEAESGFFFNSRRPCRRRRRPVREHFFFLACSPRYSTSTPPDPASLAPEMLTHKQAFEALSSFQQRQASLARDSEAFAMNLPASSASDGRTAVLEASDLARRTLIAFSSAMTRILAGIGGGEVGGAGGGGGGGGGRAGAGGGEATAPSANQDEPPSKKRACVAAGDGAGALPAAAPARSNSGRPRVTYAAATAAAPAAAVAAPAAAAPAAAPAVAVAAAAPAPVAHAGGGYAVASMSIVRSFLDRSSIRLNADLVTGLHLGLLPLRKGTGTEGALPVTIYALRRPPAGWRPEGGGGGGGSATPRMLQLTSADAADAQVVEGRLLARKTKTNRKLNQLLGCRQIFTGTGALSGTKPGDKLFASRHVPQVSFCFF